MTVSFFAASNNRSKAHERSENEFASMARGACIIYKRPSSVFSLCNAYRMPRTRDREKWHPAASFFNHFRELSNQREHPSATNYIDSEQFCRRDPDVTILD